MPYTVKEDRYADTLTRGTRVVLAQTDDAFETVLVIQKAERKTKYTYLTLGVSLDGETRLENVKYENRDKLTTLVEKLTEAERFDLDYRSAQRWAKEQAADALADVPADRLTDIAQRWHESQYGGHVLDWSDSTSFFKLQAWYKLWRSVQRTFDTLHELYGDQVTALSAVVVDLHDYRENRTSVYDPTSHSSNTMSNLLEALDRWAWEKLADDARWHVTKDVAKHELDRLRELAAARKATQPA